MAKGNLQIAIDGPVAAGKGTISKLLAEKLGILYVDTGAMYRALCYYAVREKVPFEKEEAICILLHDRQPQVTLAKPHGKTKDGRLITVFLNDKDISWKIRTEVISRGVSIITRYKCVRDYMVPLQQKLANTISVVMEGRDITTRVLPNADLKIYLDASEEIRVQRRYEESLAKGDLVSIEQIRQDLQDRDYRDMHREIDPLRKAEDAWQLDTSSLKITDVVSLIYSRLKTDKLID